MHRRGSPRPPRAGFKVGAKALGGACSVLALFACDDPDGSPGDAIEPAAVPIDAYLRSDGQGRSCMHRLHNHYPSSLLAAQTRNAR